MNFETQHIPGQSPDTHAYTATATPIPPSRIAAANAASRTKRIITRVLSTICLGIIMRHMAQHQAGDIIRAYIVLFALVPLVSVSLTTRQEAYLLLASVLLGGGLLFRKGTGNTDIVASTICLVGTAISILYHRYLISTRSYVRPRAFASVHSTMLCATFAIAGSLSLMSNSQQRKFTCDSLHNTINTHISTVLTPLRITQEQTLLITSTINGFFTKSSNDIVTEQLGNFIGISPIPTLPSNDAGGTSLASSGMTTTGARTTISNQLIDQVLQQTLSGATPAEKQYIQNTLRTLTTSGTTSSLPADQTRALIAQKLGQAATAPRGTTTLPTSRTDRYTGPTYTDASVTSTSDATDASISTPSDTAVPTDLNSLFSQYTSEYLNNPLSNKQLLDDKLCNVVFDQVKQRSSKPGFKLSIFLTLVLFFYPLLKFFSYFYSWLLTAVYRLLKKAGFIRVITHMEPAERWEV